MKETPAPMLATLLELAADALELGDGVQLAPIAKGTVEQVKTGFRHPLRHPGYTALDLLTLADVGAGTERVR